MQDHPRTYLSAALVRTRYGVSDMSLWRWLQDETLGFPHPLRINKRRFWKLADLEAWEASRTETEGGADVHASAAIREFLNRRERHPNPKRARAVR